jgi:hypothetical protein
VFLPTRRLRFYPDMASQSIAHPKLRDSRAWAPTLLLALLLGASIVTFLDKWLWSNELFNSLPMGLSYEAGEPILAALRDEAVEYCERFASPDELNDCRVYQESITDRLYFAHPLSAVVGLQARDLLNDPEWLRGLHAIGVQLPLTLGAFAVLLCLALLTGMPRHDRSMSVALIIFLLLIGQWHDRHYSPVPDALRDAGTWRAPLTLLLGAASVYLIGRRRPASVHLPFARGVDPDRSLLWAAAGLFILALVLPPMFNLALAPLALLGLFLIGLPIAARSTSLSPAVFASVFALLLVAITAAPHWFMRRLGFAGSLAQLVYIVVIALASANPRSRLVWLMPAMAVLHVPVSALLGLSTLIAELILLAFRHRPTPLLGASAVTAALGLSGAFFAIESSAFAPGSARLADAIPLILGWPGLAPALLSVALTLAFAIVPLRTPGPLSFGIGRAGLLTTAGLAASTLAVALQHHDPSLLNAPGFAMFAKSGGYATPGLFSAAILALGLALARSLDFAKEIPAGATRRFALLVVPALLLLLVVAKSDLKLRSGFAGAPVYFWRYVLAGELHPQWCRHLAEASLADNVFYLSETDPKDDAIIYWSALKARLLVDAGRADPGGMIIEPARPGSKSCPEN